MRSRLDEQPKEILQTIFSFLDDKSVRNVYFTCQLFKSHARIEKQNRIIQKFSENMESLKEEVVAFENTYPKKLKNPVSQSKNNALIYRGNLQYQFNINSYINMLNIGFDLRKNALDIRIKILKYHTYLKKITPFLEEPTAKELKQKLIGIQNSFSVLGGEFFPSDYMLDEAFLAGAPYIRITIFFDSEGLPVEFKTMGFNGKERELSENDNIHPALKDIFKIKTCEESLSLFKTLKDNPTCLDYIDLYLVGNPPFDSIGHGNYRAVKLEEMINFLESIMINKDLIENITTCRMM